MKMSARDQSSSGDRDKGDDGGSSVHSWEQTPSKNTINNNSASRTTINNKQHHHHHHIKPHPSNSFLVQVTGRIESAEIFGVNDIYCKYNLAMGGDWVTTSVIYINKKQNLYKFKNVYN
jgi:hypothetical protein